MGHFLTLALGLLAAAPTLTAAFAVPTPAPIAARAVNCDFEISANDNSTCLEFASEWALSVAQFEALNPGVVCPDLENDTLYCVSGTVTSNSTSAAVGPNRSKTTVSYTLPTGSSGPSSFDITFPTHPKTTSTVSSTTSTSVSSSHSASASGPPSPTQSGVPADCSNFHKVVKGDTCPNIEATYGISADEFAAWNPSIGSNCLSLLTGYYVCVGVPGATSTIVSIAPSTSGSNSTITTSMTSTTTSQSTSASPSSAVPSPLQPGTLSSCTSYHKVVSGDTCSAIETAAGITAAEFAAWNSGVDNSCSNIDVGYYLCIGGGPAVTSSTPSPLQPGTLSTCKTFHKVVSGDTCMAIEKAAGITATQFATWNTGVNADCTNIDVGYYVCIGV